METKNQTMGKTIQPNKNGFYEKRFKVSFEFTTDEFSFTSGVANAMKAIFPTWENVQVERIEGVSK